MIVLTLCFSHLILDPAYHVRHDVSHNINGHSLLDLFRNVHHPGTRLFIDGSTVLLMKKIKREAQPKISPLRRIVQRYRAEEAVL